ncbi:DUF1499 domain-containing protein [Loktanella sp. SALINAS62]|uniref:DUF1499 domain-containing protein n=1 Tax=Loktanella sp. SALINAS62 TaxID=2706124 RepID=UPI001B8B09A3|nr:DUF1499 domain-containing protein [Loktanella sp. SALINAS62]MBS1304150.1 DUF1499 domain-containing protein [Loktanella sp. SALINAS62]
MKTVLLLGVLALLIAVAVVIVYVRLSPTDMARYHLPPAATEPGDSGTANSFTAARQITTSAPGVLQAVMTLADRQPRNTLVAGSVDENLLTFETRSRLMGYPDYTTVTVVDDDSPLLIVQGRSRFGKSDMGVNWARVQNWLTQLGPLVVPLS